MSVFISIEWDKFQNLQIRDVHEKQRERIKEYAKQHVLSNELFHTLGYHEEQGFQEDLQKFLQHLLENDCSIVVLDRETNEIQAVALLKWMSEEWRSWTALRLLINAKHMAELVDFIRGFAENCAVEMGEKWDSLHLFFYYVETEWRTDDCFMLRFFNAICEVARHMHMPRITYMTLSGKEHQIMQEMGFKELKRILYSMYVYKGRRPFDHLRDVNEMFAAFFEKKVEPILPFQELTIRHDNSEELEKFKGEDKAK